MIERDAVYKSILINDVNLMMTTYFIINNIYTYYLVLYD